MKRTWKNVRPILVCGDVATIALADGRSAIIDAEDVPLVSDRNWSCGKSKGCSVVSGAGRLSHVITGAPPREIVDHRDGDPLNNRRANLRRATSAQNSQNRRRRSGATSEFKGVSWRADRGTWLAAIRQNGLQRKLGTFNDEVSAARAYDEAARTAFGTFAALNFPVDGEVAA